MTPTSGPRPPLASVPVNSRGKIETPKWEAKARIVIGSAMILNGYVYSHDWGLTCHRASDGNQMFGPTRVRHEGQQLGGRMFGGLIAIGDLIYICHQAGNVAVIKTNEANGEFESVAMNRINEPGNMLVYATMAACNGKLYLRSQKYLYCIAEE